MMDWDDVNMEALGVAVLITFLFSLFTIFDVVGVGWDNSFPLLMRILLMLIFLPIAYLVSEKMINN